MNYKLRPNVVAVYLNDNGEVLVGQRADSDTVWQLPQGGIDDGETPEQAVVREAKEEAGISHSVILKKSAKQVSYLFPKNFKAPIAKAFDGQIQWWFILEIPKGEKPDIDKSDGEFKKLDWWPIKKLCENIVDWKIESYKKGFDAIGLEIK